MSYIGKTPAVGNFVKLDAISTSSTNTYNLTVDSVAFVPESANHMLVSLNGVIQAPLSSFSVSGSTITFIPASGTLSSSDSIDFIMVYGNILDIGVCSDATVTNAKTNFVSTSSSAGLQIKGDNTTAGTLQLNCEQNSHGIKLRSPSHSAGASYTLTFPTTDGNADEFLQTNGSGVLTWASAGGNSPSFHAYLSSTTEVANGTNVKLPANTEIFDSDNAYDNSSNYRFTPQTAGKYFVYGLINGTTNAYAVYNVKAMIYKNGSEAITNNNHFANDNIRRLGVTVQSIVDMNGSSDYVELWGHVDIHVNGTEQFIGSGTQSSYFGAFRIG